MRKISIFISLTIVLVLFIAMGGCKKEHSESQDMQTTNPGLSVNNARDWFETSKSAGLNLSEGGKSVSFQNFTPDWENAIISEDENYYVVECPASFAKPFGFSVKKTSVNDIIQVNGFSRLLILKSKRHDNIKAVLMNIHSYSNQAGNKISYKAPGENFNGMIFFTDVNNNFINGWEYKNGKVIAEIKQVSNSKNGAARAVPGCEEILVDVFQRDCYYFPDPSLNYCTEWQFIGTITYTICPPGSGGGGGGIPDVENILMNFKSNYEMSETSYMQSIIGVYFDGVIKERGKDYKWVCAQAALIKAISLEHGVHKQVNNEWQWKSLTHQSVSISGTVVGGSVSVVSHSGLPQLGIYYSSMKVNFTLHYNVIIPNASPISWYRSHGPTIFINVND